MEWKRPGQEQSESRFPWLFSESLSTSFIALRYTGKKKKEEEYNNNNIGRRQVEDFVFSFRILDLIEKL